MIQGISKPCMSVADMITGKTGCIDKTRLLDTIILCHYFTDCSFFQLKAQVLDDAPPGVQSVGYFCVVRIELPHGLHADGVGVTQQPWSHTGTVCAWQRARVCAQTYIHI